MKLISVVTPCRNEEENVRELYEAVKAIFDSLPRYDLEHLFIDNASRDNTVAILKDIARSDKRVKIIVNTRNFGSLRSPYHGILQSTGDAAILLVCDFQDPPELIRKFLVQWEQGCKAVIAVKTRSAESALMFRIRTFYYDLLGKLANIELTKNTTGFGLYDRTIIETLRKVDDPDPYIRGLLCDIGFESAKINYSQPRRRRGVTKNDFYTLYDIAILGITHHSKVPLRIASMAGFVMSILSLMAAFCYLVAKLLFWNWFTVGIAPILISLFFLSSLQMFFIGIIGEYIGSIYTQVQKRPLVIEKERINF